jgi:hypothetical protein
MVLALMSGAAVSLVVASGIVGAVVWLIFVALFSLVLAPSEMDRDARTRHRAEVESVERFRNLAEHERDLARAEIADLQRGGDVIRTFVALFDEGAAIHDVFSITLPYPVGSVDAAIASYESWWGRCAGHVHDHRPAWDLRFRESQALPNGPIRHGPGRLMGVDGEWFDTALPREFQIRVEQVRILLRQIVDPASR